MQHDSTTLPGFESFGLDPALLRAIKFLNYEKPTSIQEQAIAPQLAGQDVLGQAQTGTGKTAAFALPLLNNLDVKNCKVQVLVLTPTRELAIQVTEHFEQFAKFMSGVKILSVYGGADIRRQLSALKRGVHIVVGTPGRVMDHIRRDSLKLNTLTNIVLDEADEMLRMGFQEDVEWILERAPEERQMSLYSATIPPSIRRIAKRFMHNPCEVTIHTKTTTVDTLNQRYWLVSGLHRLDALSRILEVEDYDGVIVFVRTRADTVKLAEDLENRGFNAAPLSGDMPQNQREKTVDRLKAKRIDILVATDVAARGLDVERISHVINYDVPHDAEAYIHRVGRTGRAGRSGEAILFLSKRDQGMLRSIEKATRQKIEELDLPKTKQINDQRIASFKRKITDTIEGGKLDLFKKIVLELNVDSDLDPFDIAAAAASMSQGEQPLLLTEKVRPAKSKHENRTKENYASGNRRGKHEYAKERFSDSDMEKYRVEVGLVHGVKAGNLLGAITNEAGIDGRDVGRINIRDEFSTIDLPLGMPPDILQELKKVWVSGQQLCITLNSNSSKRRNGKKPFDSGKQRKRGRSHQGLR
ncbi:MAG: DEAD/DEAH box helicase [Candidatus Hatepunaea meridiana]|nr:DEAD/DEAH box helicase [Candidatus Hatepunaea meridiana]